MLLNQYRYIFVLCIVTNPLIACQKQLQQALEKLKTVYPYHIQAVCADYILLTDGTRMHLGNHDEHKTTAEKLSNPSLADHLLQSPYVPGMPNQPPENDPGRIRYEPFFRKMYGNSPDEVAINLVNVPWMPKIFGQETRILKVTTIHKIDKKIETISHDLEELVAIYPEYIEFLKKPGGTFCWRTIANTTRLSAHSFGMTIDINAQLSDYWQWDLKKENLPIDEDAKLVYRNTIPWEIIEIFERQGFIWGGKWYHYDTMHFEYRPELIVSNELDQTPSNQ